MTARRLLFISLLFTGELAACPLPEKEVLYLLMQSHDVPLTVDSSCKNVGTEGKDKTIGEFVSGFWVHHRKKAGKNWIAVQSKSLDQNRCQAKVEIYRKHGEEVIGGWGVSFIVDNASRKSDRASFKCVGGG